MFCSRELANMYQKEKIRHAFFGRENLSDRVIITPLSFLYNSLFKDYKTNNETRGWWNSKDIEVDGNSISVLKIPQGYSIVDAVLSLDNPEKIIFMGYAGGNSEKVKVGSIVYPISAIRGNEAVTLPESKLITVPDSIHKGSLIHADTFLEQDNKFINRIIKEGISSVDMETFLLYSISEKNNYGSHSFVIVSDLIDKKPFYKISSEDIEQIKASYGQLEELVVNAAKN